MKKIVLPMLLLGLAASASVAARPEGEGDREVGPRFGTAQTRPREAEPRQGQRQEPPQVQLPRPVGPRPIPQQQPQPQQPPPPQQSRPQFGSPAGHEDRNRGRDSDNRNWNNNGGWRGNGLGDRRDDQRQSYNQHEGDQRRDYDRHWDNDRGRNHWERNRYDGYRERYFQFNNGRFFGRQRYWLGDYFAPRGFSTRVWYVGDWLPYAYYDDVRYHIDDPWSFNLYDPPIGCHWVRVGADALLIDYYSGEILEVVYSLFW